MQNLILNEDELRVKGERHRSDFLRSDPLPIGAVCEQCRNTFWEEPLCVDKEQNFRDCKKALRNCSSKIRQPRRNSNKRKFAVFKPRPKGASRVPQWNAVGHFTDADTHEIKHQDNASYTVSTLNFISRMCLHTFATSDLSRASRFLMTHVTVENVRLHIPSFMSIQILSDALFLCYLKTRAKQTCIFLFCCSFSFIAIFPLIMEILNPGLLLYWECVCRIFGIVSS